MLGVGSYSVGLGLFVAGGVVAAGGMTVGVSFGLLCGGCCPPLVAGLSVCHCGFGLWWLMAGEEHGGWGACGGSFRVSRGGFSLWGVFVVGEGL